MMIEFCHWMQQRDACGAFFFGSRCDSWTDGQRTEDSMMYPHHHNGNIPNRTILFRNQTIVKE